MSTANPNNRRSETARDGGSLVRRLLEIGGFAAGAVLIAFGIGAIVMGFDGRSTVVDNLEQEKIVGSPDMTPELIVESAQEADLDLTEVEIPDSSVADEPIDTASKARTFAEYMRIHALMITDGATYAEMGRFEAAPDAPEAELAPGGGTSNPEFAATDPETGQPVENEVRDTWVTQTALGTALNSAYMADRISVFGIVVGIALLLSGIGFVILAVAALHRKRQDATAA